MKIESIKKSEKRPDRFVVLFDEGTEIRVSAIQIADFGLYTGLELSDEQYSELSQGLIQSTSKARALRILGNRSLSAREIEKRLIQKGESEETAQNTVGWLEDIGYISDTEYAAAIVKHYSSKGYGLARIKDELYRRGIQRDLWDTALQDLGGMQEAAQEFLKKKLRGSLDKEDMRRAVDALCRRGFQYQEAREALNRYLEEAEEPEEITYDH